MGLGNIEAVFRFEWRRAMQPSRVLWWIVLAAFPIFLVAMVRLIPTPQPPPTEFWAFFLFALIPMLVTMLGTLMWTAPAISAELERRSWIYIATRPDGRTALLLGKYLAGITWVIPAAVTGLVVSALLTGSENLPRLLGSLLGVTLLACPAYGSAYLLLGVMFPQRSMVLAVAYSLIFEVVVSFIPAVINKLTVQYRLRSLLFNWVDLWSSMPPEMRNDPLFVPTSSWIEVMILLIYPCVLLTLSVLLIRSKEFSSAQESET